MEVKNVDKKEKWGKTISVEPLCCTNAGKHLCIGQAKVRRHNDPMLRDAYFRHVNSPVEIHFIKTGAATNHNGTLYRKSAPKTGVVHPKMAKNNNAIVRKYQSIGFVQAPGAFKLPQINSPQNQRLSPKAGRFLHDQREGKGSKKAFSQAWGKACIKPERLFSK